MTRRRATERTRNFCAAWSDREGKSSRSTIQEQAVENHQKAAGGTRLVGGRSGGAGQSRQHGRVCAGKQRGLHRVQPRLAAGGDHTVFTHADSTIAAIEAGLKLLRKDGVMCVSIYYGGASGYEERDALLEYVRTIDPAQYTVLVTQFANRAGDPPIPGIYSQGNMKTESRGVSLCFPCFIRRKCGDIRTICKRK